MTMNVGEYGLVFNLNVNFDISAATSLQLTITRPDGTTITGTPTVGSVDLVTTDDGTYLAHKYCIYTFQNGDLNQAGTYTARLAYTDSTPLHLISDPTSFDVSV